MARNIFLWSLIAVLGLCYSSARCNAGEELVELTLESGKEKGKILAFDKKICVMVKPDGMLKHINLNDIQKYQKHFSKFTPYTKKQIAKELSTQFGNGYEIKTGKHYVVVAKTGYAKKYVELCEEVYSSFYQYFTLRGFKLKQSEFPLVLIVFGNHKQFEIYAKQDGVKTTKGLLGYYQPKTNRVAMFELSTHLSKVEQSIQPGGG